MPEAWVFDLKRPKLWHPARVALEVAVTVLLCILVNLLVASDALFPGLFLSCVIWFLVRRYGGGTPWLRWGVLHYIPVCLLIAVLHQAAGSPWHKLGPRSGLPLLDSAAVISASFAMYKHALRKWEHLPHPAWEGFPIFWREGPEHAAAALSERLRLMRWHLEFQWWETSQSVLHHFDRAADKLQSEGLANGSAAAATPRLPDSNTNPLARPPLNSTPEKATPPAPLDSIAEEATPLTTSTSLNAPLPLEGAADSGFGGSKEYNSPFMPPTNPEDNAGTEYPATVVQKPATTASTNDDEAFAEWLECGKHALSFLRIPITVQAGGAPTSEHSSMVFDSNVIIKNGLMPAATNDRATVVEMATHIGATTQSHPQYTSTDQAGAADPCSLQPTPTGVDDVTNEAPPVHDPNTCPHVDMSHRRQAATSKIAVDAQGPVNPAATPHHSPLASLRRSASLLKEKMVAVKGTMKGKRGTNLTPTRDTGISRPDMRHTNATPSCRRKAKEVAASIRRKLVPTRTSRGARGA